MNKFKTNLQLFAEGDETKTFTQEDVDRIIGERLARVKAEKPADYDELKQIAETLEEFEAYKGLSATDKKALLKQAAEETRQQTELRKLEQMAEEEGITPALAKKMKDLEDKLEKSNKFIEEITNKEKQAIEEQQTKAKLDEAWKKQVNEMEEAHPNVDLKALEVNQKFLKFIKGKGLPLKELYEDFVEFIGETEAETIISIKSKELRSTSSGKGSSSDGGGYGLTDRQKNLAKTAGMTFKEYAEYQKQII